MIAVLLVSGCYYDYDYEYVSLEESMEVVEYGKTELRNVRDHTEIPIRYKLERDQYILYGAVDKKSIPPAVVFTVEGKTLTNASIEGAYIKCIAYFNAIRPSEVRHSGYPEGGIRFSWKPDLQYPPCQGETMPIGKDRKAVISIFDDSIGFISKEELQFDIKTNGIYRENDSL